MKEYPHSSYRPILITVGFLILTVSLTIIQVYFRKIEGTSLIASNILVLTLINVNLILLVLLLLLLSRNLVKLYFERRQRVPGSGFRAKLIFAFIGFTLIPSILLFVANGLLTNSLVENWFNLQVENSLKDSLEVAQIHYRSFQDNAIYFAKGLSRMIAEEGLIDENRGLLKKVIRQKQREYNLGAVEVFSVKGDAIATAISRELQKTPYVLPERDFVKKGLKGEEIVNINPLGKGDIVRGIVPLRSASSSNVVGAVVVSYYISQGLVARADGITKTFEEYKQVKAFKKPIKSNYLLFFLIITTVIIFSATWFGFYLARGITVPIQKLAEGTKAIAQGNLDFKIDVKANDEIGVLVDSFNLMTEDLKVSKEDLEKANVSLRESNIELDRRRTYIETVLENIATGVISINREGQITTFNRSAERILGIRAEDIRGKSYRELFKLLRLERAESLIRRISERGQAIVGEEFQLVANKRVLHLRLNVSSLLDNQGEFIGMVIVFEDLSELIKAQKVAAWEEVARRIAHEIKNPLTPIQLSTQRMRKKFFENSQDFADIFNSCTNTIIQEVNSLKSLVDEFSNFARMPAVNPVPGDLHDVIKEVIHLYQGSPKGLKIITNLAPDLPVVNFDGEQMKRVFINLFENGIAAMDGNGHLWIATSFDQRLKVVRIEVADEGAGIQPEDKDKLFLPYFSKKRTGTGLGLAIVNRIVAEHNGYIRVENNEPKGVIFIIELPVQVGIKSPLPIREV